MDKDKEKLKQEGYRVVDSTQASSNSIKEKLAKIQSLLPPLINGDGLLDIPALKDFLGIENIASANQGYGIMFAGKGLARIKADEPTNKELKIEDKQSKKLAETENIIIRGDNLDALKILHQNYYEKVKTIYIDPPYNTDSDGFIYTDRFREDEAALIEKYQIDEEAIDFLDNILGTKSHSGWLYFIYPRLKLARDLLTDDGVIFISIDDNEQANLKLLCDEIFGERNVDCFVWHKSGDGRYGKMKNTTTFRKDHEYIITAYKNYQSLNKLWDYPQFQNQCGNPDNDPRGPFLPGSVSMREDASNPQHKNYYSVISPSGKKFSRQFDIPKGKFDELNNDNRIFWGKSNNSVPLIKIFINERRFVTPSSLIKKGSTYDGTKELDRILEGIEARDIRPKPSSLLFLLTQLATKKDSHDIVLDFFAGSGTTAEAVMELNKEDGGNRKFILVQWDEKINPKKSKPAYDFCKQQKLEPLISSICIERVHRAGDRIQEELGLEIKGGGGGDKKATDRAKDLDIGYKVFSLTDHPDIEEKDGQFNLTQVRASTDNKLYNMMAASGGALLSDRIEEIEKDLLYKINDAYYVLGECKTDLSQFAGRQIYIDGYADIRLQKWLNLIGLDKENITILF